MSKEAPSEYHLDNMYNYNKHINNHDISGVRGITRQQMVELEKKKVKYRVDNELYLRRHPQLQNMVSVFLFKVLEEKPSDILSYAGKFFDQPELQKIIDIQTKHYMGKQSQ